MFLTQTTLRATVSVCVLLVLSIVATGFVSSAYKKERASLGQAHFEHGQAYAAGGEMGPAIEEYRQALIFSPDQTDYRLSLARALIDANRLDEAQAHLEQLLQEDPTNGVINLLLAHIAVQRHKLPEAIDYYQRAVYEYWPASEMPARRQARWELVRLLDQTGNRSQYIAELMQLYSNAPALDLKQIAEIGFLLLRTGAISEASEVFRDLAKSSPKDADARRGLGEVAFSDGNYVSARHEFQRAQRLAPNNPQISQALALTNEVIDLDPALPHIPLAERLRRSGNLLTRVIKDLQACLPEAAPASEPAKPAPAATQPKINPTPTAQTPKTEPASPLQQRLDAARQLLSPGKHGASDDVALQLQDTAQQLWKDRAMFCGQRTVSDRAVETVLPRIAHE